MTTGQKATQVIEKLGIPYYKTVPSSKLKPILIGDVLSDFWKNWRGKLNDDGLLRFLDLWGACGADRSLQDIAEMREQTISGIDGTVDGEQLRSESKALIEFLHSIFIKDHYQANNQG